MEEVLRLSMASYWWNKALAQKSSPPPLSLESHILTSRLWIWRRTSNQKEKAPPYQMTDMLKDLLALSHTPRWTTHPVHRPQSVAEHSYRVAVISKAILDGILVDDHKHASTIMWALVHDGPEAKTGDVPSPIKHAWGREKLYEFERKVCPWYSKPRVDSCAAVVVSLADTIEALSWIKHYGHGLRDRFDDEQIEHQLNRRIWTEAKIQEANFGGIEEAVRRVMQIVCP